MKLIIGLSLLLAFLVLLSIHMGTADVPVMQGFIDYVQNQSTSGAIIIGEIRLPRTLLAILVGAALGLSGAALQGLLRNPLVDPGLLGVSQGAAVMAALVFYFNGWLLLGALAVPVAGLLGALITLLILMGLSGSVSRPGVIIMVGLALSSIASALLAVVLNFAPNPYTMQELVFWLLGSVSGRGMDHVWILLPALILGAVLLFSQQRLLLGLSLGDQVAQSMGLKLKQGSRLIVFGSAILIGSSVAVAGNIAFVGLMVPHLLRRFVQYRPDRLLLPSMIAGAILVLAADLLVRWLPPQQELKLGVVTAIIGTPLLLWLVWQERRRWM